MFSYYGCKTRVVDHYPPPRHNLIIEPFAGSARYALKYWDIRQGSYLTHVKNHEATWFVDPPYSMSGGDKYVHGSDKLDFKTLAEWCKTRKGFVMVCESMEATWLDFKLLKKSKTQRGYIEEGIWTNQPTAFDLEQLKLQI